MANLTEMSILQQLHISKVKSTGLSQTVSYHRRTNTILVAEYVDNGGVSKIKSLRNSPTDEWVLCGEYSFGEKLQSKVIAFFPLEAYEAFMVLCADEQSTCLVFNLSLKLVNIVNISVRSPVCADFDQNRKDLVIGTKGGKVLALAVRQLTNRLPAGKIDPENHSPFKFQVILRCRVHLDSELGRKTLQIATVDLNGTVLVLTESVNILCLDSSTLETLWIVQSTCFVFQPCKIWVDKFGSNFLVYCKSLEGKGNSLEYWSPPVDYSLCSVSQFSRSCLTLSSNILGAAIESLAGENVSSTHVIIVQVNAALTLLLILFHLHSPN